MSYVTQSIARQQAIISANNAQSSIINANQSMQDLAKSKADIRAIQAKEQQLIRQKEQAELEAKIAKKKKEEQNKKNKLNYFA